MRGTVWRVEDRCDGTLTTVERGSAVVYDFVRKRRVTVTAGKKYLARLLRPVEKTPRNEMWAFTDSGGYQPPWPNELRCRVQAMRLKLARYARRSS